MRNIVIVEIASTGANFIQDIINRNYNSIGLKLKSMDVDEWGYNELVDKSLESIEADFELIHEKDSYEETLEMVKKYDPLLVIAGSEKGVILATKLANDLNLLCNPIENLDAMTLKDKMQEKIAEKGLRHIRGQTIHSIEEAIEFYDKSGFEKVVIKPIYSAGSVGLKICSNKEEMINSLEELFNDVNLYGDKIDEFIVQEYIDGEEYCVNTASCNGDHRVTLIWKYHKFKTTDGSNIYDYRETVNELNIGEASLVEYAYNVADALGIKYGAVHGEYMVDENGPVLIEVNCRPCGGNMDAEYLDSFSGQHETDNILDSYLNPKNFYYERDKGYKLYGYGIMKFFSVPKDIIAESSPMAYISNKLQSHYKTTPGIFDEARTFVKTQNLETTEGTVYLSHPDGHQIRKDLDFLRSVEKHAFQLVLSSPSSKEDKTNEEKSDDDIKSILRRIRPYGSCLFITDQIFEEMDLMQVKLDKVDDVKGKFDCVVLNLNKSISNKNADCLAYYLLKTINKVKNSGLILIPESTYQYAPNGRIGIEALIKVLDLKIELPLHNLNKVKKEKKR